MRLRVAILGRPNRFRRNHQNGDDHRLILDCLDREPDQATRMAHPQIARIRRTEHGYPAYRTPMDLPVARTRAVSSARSKGFTR